MADPMSQYAQKAALEAVETLTGYIEAEAEPGLNRIDMCMMAMVFMMYTFLRTVDRNDGDSRETKKKFDAAVEEAMGWGRTN